MADSREVFGISLSPEDGKYAIEYAKRLGLPKTVFLQRMVAEMLEVLREEPMPEQQEPEVLYVDEPKEVLLPQHTTFWKRYKEGMK